MEEGKIVACYDTLFSADCAEFCPFEEKKDLLIVGTYQLKDEEDGQKKYGRSDLIDCSGYLNGVSSRVEPLHSLNSEAILDIKWSGQKIGEKMVFCQVECGGLRLMEVFEEEESHKMRQVEDIRTNEKDVCLSLDWNNKLFSASDSKISVSHSDGKISLWQIESRASKTREISAHENEAWVVSFDCHNPNLIYSGSDDCTLKGWDLREEKSCFVNRKTFSMGVTCAQKSVHDENELLVGSYDENVYLFDTRQMSKPKVEKKLGNGVWRVKWHPKLSHLFVTATMHGGFHVCEWRREEQEIQILYNYNKHQSLAYGVDWRHASEEKESVIASCSFYDHFCSIWKYKR